MPRKTGLDPDEPTLRLALKESDFRAMMERLDGWDHPVFWRLKTKWAEHQRALAANRPRRRATA